MMMMMMVMMQLQMLMLRRFALCLRRGHGGALGNGGAYGGAATLVAAAAPRHQHHQLLEDSLVGVGAGAGAIHNRVLGRALLFTSDAPHKYLPECFAKLSRHAAIYAKVNWITKHQKEIGQHYKYVGNAIVQEFNDQRADNVHSGNDGNGYFSNQKNRDDNNQHQGGAIGIPQPLALLLAVLAEQQLAPLLRLPQGSKQQNVERHQNNARQQIDK